jgi:hypothetical protein
MGSDILIVQKHGRKKEETTKKAAGHAANKQTGLHAACDELVKENYANATV